MAGQARAIRHSNYLGSRQAEDGQTSVTVTVPQGPNTCKLESHEDSPQAKHPFRGKGRGNKRCLWRVKHITIISGYVGANIPP